MLLRELMHTDVATMESSQSARAAWLRMQKHHLRQLIVMAEGQPVGIVTATDVLDALGRTPTRATGDADASPVRTPARRARPAKGKLKRKPVTDLAQIPVHIRSAGSDLSAEERERIRRKLCRRLGRFAESIDRVSVRMEDLNGPRGGVDRACRIKVVLSGLPSVVVEKRDASVNGAIDGALTGAAKAVRRAVQRRRMKPLRRAAGKAAGPSRDLSLEE